MTECVAVVGDFCGTLPHSHSQRIWKEAEFRAASLKRADEGKGDTLWTARVRRVKSDKD